MSERQGFLGGSDIASALGISPWKTPYALWEEKVYGITEDSTEQRDKVLKRGKRLEPVVMEMLQDEYDLAVTGRNVIYWDDEYPWMRAEIDFEHVLEDGSIGNGDVKTVHPYAAKDWGEAWSDQVPAYYVAQFQWGQMIPNRQQTFVAALIGADDLRPYIVKRDEEIIAYMRKEAITFWNKYVLPKKPPPIKTAEDCKKVLAKFDGVTVAASEDVRQVIEQLKEVRAQEKELKLKTEGFENAIKLTLALNASLHQTPGRTAIVDEEGFPLVTWNEQSRAGYTVAPTTFRVLRLCK